MADGTSRDRTEIITEADVRDIEDGIESYLVGSWLPARPRGYRWFMRLPAAVEDEREFWRRLNEADLRMPHQERDLIREAANLGAAIRGLFELSTHV